PRARLRPARDGHDLAGGSRARADPGRGTPLLGRTRLDGDLPDDRLGRRGPRHHRARPGRFVRALWSARIGGSRALGALSAGTPAAAAAASGAWLAPPAR